MTSSTRRRARNRLYLVGVLPALLLLLVSGRIALVLQAESSGQDNYARSAFGPARDSFATNALLNPFERWIAPFDEGVARHRGGDLGGAVDSYEVALEHVPESWECAVRSNLALAHEAIGDAVSAERRVAAEASWTAGREALADCLTLQPPTGEDSGDGEDDSDRADAARQVEDRATAEVIDARLAAKLIDARTDPAPEPAPAVPPDETFAEREQRLDERDRRSLEERREQEQVEQELEDRPDPDDPPPVPTW
ncbi:hypothetical protein NPS01_29990 [Nocardioides psychrotolerans]|uniref:Tetratricopeptide repeat-containing protein n=1 Tax=Nocardioides psychrotolerans TaxID=1005945 RepID=A0A1I3GKR5_9ACTN|nr:hypothetical protein [Nocardioides psychrotolerans]GEP39336.1 hypothetical protein NPS01_29990 [Nocardioides psychrotolerans]SFI24075.1 hypothetical protein SAMN05216561_106177 [Nocardioides psychrotolerans]